MATGIIPSFEEINALEDEVFNIQALIDVTESALRFYGEEVIQPKDFIEEIRTLGIASKKLGELAQCMADIHSKMSHGGSDES